MCNHNYLYHYAKLSNIIVVNNLCVHVKYYYVKYYRMVDKMVDKMVGGDGADVMNMVIDVMDVMDNLMTIKIMVNYVDLILILMMDCYCCCWC